MAISLHCFVGVSQEEDLRDHLWVYERMSLFSGFHPFSCLQALSRKLQINADFSGDFDDVGRLSAGCVDTAKIMSLGSQVLLNHSGDQNGLLGRIHANTTEEFLFPVIIFLKFLFFSVYFVMLSKQQPFC